MMGNGAKTRPSDEQTVAKYIEDMDAPGYERLAFVLHRAFLQAAEGKGHERHANGEPFHEQVMQTGAHRFGVGSLLFQAFKKSEESQRLPHDAAVRELLGAINYLAGAVIARERMHSAATAAPKAANDNRPRVTVDAPVVKITGTIVGDGRLPGQGYPCCGAPFGVACPACKRHG